MVKESEWRLFRDPLHGFIQVRKELLPVVNSKEFQRLRRVSQLGVSRLAYHGAEYSRLGHSLGVYHLFQSMIGQLSIYGLNVDEADLLAGLAAALLHDIGHGPFSHVLERVITPEKDHEEWTHEIILGATEVHEALAGIDASFPERVSKVLKGGNRLTTLISSQLDADRVDYLLRDSLFCGVSYGRFDVDRLIRTMLPYDKSPFVVIDYSGQMAVEGYLLARYFMYWQVYYHKTTRGFESLLRQLWEYVRSRYRNGTLDSEWVPRGIRPFLVGSVGLDDYLALDDCDVISALKLWATSRDEVLRDVATRLLEPHRLKSVEFSTVLDYDVQKKIEDVLRNFNYTETSCYMILDKPSNVAYDYYTSGEEEGKPPILIMDRDGKTIEIAQKSGPIRALAGQRVIRFNLYVPEECAIEVERIMRSNMWRRGTMFEKYLPLACLIHMVTEIKGRKRLQKLVPGEG